MKKKKQDEKVKLNKTNKQKENPIKDFPGKEIDLTKFNLLSDKAQYDEIKKVLEDNKNELALCVDNCAAIEFTDQFISVIKSSKKAKAYKAYYKDRLYLEDIN